MTVVGFTGTRSGMSGAQRSRMQTLMRLLKVTELHHGQCVGADEQAAIIAGQAGAHVVSHPPENTSLMSVVPADEVREPRAYLARNRDIVDECEHLLVCPLGEETQRSGTWSTVRYARRTGRSYIVIRRDGVVVQSRSL